MNLGLLFGSSEFRDATSAETNLEDRLALGSMVLSGALITRPLGASPALLNVLHLILGAIL